MAMFSIAPGSLPGFIALIVNIALVCYLLAMKMIMMVVMSKLNINYPFVCDPLAPDKDRAASMSSDWVFQSTGLEIHLVVRRMEVLTRRRDD